MMVRKYSLMTCWRLQNGAFLGYAVLILLTASPLTSAVTRELPNTYPYIVQKGYIEAFVGKWDEPAHTLFKTITERVKEATLRIVETHFGNYTHSRFKQRVS
jgi:hypothetical protein